MKTCTNCGKLHTPAVDICDRCGSMAFIPYNVEKKVTIGDIIKEKSEEKKVEPVVEEKKEEVIEPIVEENVTKGTSKKKSK